VARSRTLRWLVRGVAALLLLIVGVLATGLIYRAWATRRAERQLIIVTPDGIDEALFVTIGGVAQWITIRGQHANNPIVLMLHGGPGAEQKGFAVSFLPWEKDFVIVQWDQPGAGRTFRAAGNTLDPGLTIERMARDGNDLAAWLTRRFHRQNIILLGWSWGSALGTHMVKARPDLFAAYVGTGQIVNMDEGEALAYSRVLGKARAQDDRAAIRDLEAIGPPPYDSLSKLGTQRKWASMYEVHESMLQTLVPTLFMAPRSSLRDSVTAFFGMMQSQEHFFGSTMNGPLAHLNLRMLGNRFDVPMFVVQGTEDDYTPAALSRAWVDSIEAPQKAFLPISGAGHLALVTRTTEFVAIVTQHVRPLTRVR
jgi:pimeloyl-ACP methyl ester carboxylesterase